VGGAERWLTMPQNRLNGRARARRGSSAGFVAWSATPQDAPWASVSEQNHHRNWADRRSGAVHAVYDIECGRQARCVEGLELVVLDAFFVSIRGRRPENRVLLKPPLPKTHLESLHFPSVLKVLQVGFAPGVPLLLPQPPPLLNSPSLRTK